MRILSCVLIVILSTCSAFADHDISVPYTAPEMTISVDGDLADWAGATWIACDENYSGVAADVTAASYAFAWNSTTNLLYVAVQVTDTDDYMVPDYITWNGQDGVELYVDAEIDVNQFSTYHDVAQQIMTGTDGDEVGGVCGTWTVQIVGGVTQPAAVIDSMVAVVDGDDIVYEYAITPYGYYADFGGTVEAANRVATLAADQTIGFDVVVSSLNGLGNFGMLCNNTVGGKHSQSEKFQTWTLAGGGSDPHPGDANDDGTVNLDDFILLKQNYGNSGASWGQGDFDGNGTVNLDDFIILKQNYGWSAS